MPSSFDLALGRVIANLHREVFGAKDRSPNKPLNKGTHLFNIQDLDDATKLRDFAAQMYVWGPAGDGQSDETLHWPPTHSRYGVGRFLDFNGAGDRVEIDISFGNPYTEIVNIFDGGGTAEAHVYPRSDGEGNEGTILDKDSWSLQVIEEDGNGNLKLRFTQKFSTQDGIWESVLGDVGINNWYVVAVVYDNSSVSNDPVFYVTYSTPSVVTEIVGVVETQTPIGTRTTDSLLDFNVGDNEAANRSFDGLIDEVRLWSSSRTQSEIQDNSFTEVPINTANLELYFRFNEGSGTTTQNHSTTDTDEDGDLIGVPTWVNNVYAARWGISGVWRSEE